MTKERSQKKTSLQKPGGVNAWNSAVVFLVDGGKRARAKGSQCSRVMATAAAPACLRCVPSFSPTLQAPPLSRSVTKPFFPPRPFSPRRLLPLDRKKHVGPRVSFEPGRMGAEVRRSSALRRAELPKQRVGSGGEKVGRVTWARWGWRGAAGDVALSRAQARDQAV